MAEQGFESGTPWSASHIYDPLTSGGSLYKEDPWKNPISQSSVQHNSSYIRVSYGRPETKKSTQMSG